MRTRVKFCGLTRVEDVRTAVALGVDAIGLVIAADSPRRLSVQQAHALRAALPPFVAAVLLSMDADPAGLRIAVDALRPDLLQFHGSEAAADCARYGVPYLKAIPMAQPDEAAMLLVQHPAARGFVFDSHAVGTAGGSGRAFDWAQLPRCERPVVLAGGLHADNVFDAVQRVRPYAVDVSSGIETAPGIKDHDSMRRFLQEVRRADRAIDD